MTPRMKAILVLLALFFVPIACSDSAAQLSSATNRGSLNSSLGSASVGALPAVPVAPSLAGPGAQIGVGDTGPLGIGKPRTFPIVRHFRQRHAINKAKIRESALGKLLRGMLKPLSALTGGVVPAEPVPNHVQLAAPGPQGSAAKIKKDQLEAPQRLAAIQALGEVDCHWYPEALTQLLHALRADRSDCVRFEAAKILSQCNCCSPAMLLALRVCVAGTETDGNPAERSLRIRNQAAIALANCLACTDANQLQRLPQQRPEYPAEPAPDSAPEPAPAIDPRSYYSQADVSDAASSKVVPAGFAGRENPPATKSNQDIIEESKALLEQFRQLQSQSPANSKSSDGLNQQDRRTSWHDVWRKSRSSR